MLDAITARRSIRKYEPRPVEPEAIEVLKEVALRSPSSMNRQPWHFVFVTDADKLARLAHAKRQYGEFIADAPLGIAICGDEGASDCWIEDCSIAATALQLAITELGLGSCWIQIRDRQDAKGDPAEKNVRDILGLSDTWRVLCLLAVGHPAEQKAPRPRDQLKWDRITDA